MRSIKNGVILLLFSLNLISCAIKQSSQINSVENLKGDYFNENFIRYEDFIYKNNIKTVMLHKEGFELSSPIIELNGSDKLQLSFDDLDAGVKNYYYTFIHCNADWQPSELISNQYIYGFAEDKITDYQFSFNTIQKYTHYNLIFPNESIKPTLSGNYILKVFADYDQNNIVFTKRFMVLDAKVSIDANVHQATQVSERNIKHEVDFTIYHSQYPIQNPHEEITAIIRQNEKWDNALFKLKPLFIKEQELVYDYEQGNTFLAGNEFRSFDTRSLRFQTERVRKIEFDSTHHVLLLTDEARTFGRYSAEADINGRYYIDVQEGRNKDIEADYAYVHFKLSYEAPIIDGNLYIFGALTNWSLKEEAKLKYNYEKMLYETALFLKQGYYNYKYVYVKDGSAVSDENLIEGSRYETENDYSIYIYHRAVGKRYDQLIGIKQLNSIKIY